MNGFRVDHYNYLFAHFFPAIFSHQPRQLEGVLRHYETLHVSELLHTPGVSRKRSALEREEDQLPPAHLVYFCAVGK